MLEMLQKDGGRDGAVTVADGPAEIVLNNSYVDTAKDVVSRARSEVRIFAYAWRWYEHKPESKIQSFNAAIVQAVRRGVVVRAIVDNDQIYQMLVARGVQCRFIAGKRSMHAKVIAGDRHDILIGSHNLTMRAFEDNIEASILVHDFEPVEQFCEYFDRVWSACG